MLDTVPNVVDDTGAVITNFHGLHITDMEYFYGRIDDNPPNINQPVIPTNGSNYTNSNHVSYITGHSHKSNTVNSGVNPPVPYKYSDLNYNIIPNHNSANKFNNFTPPQLQYNYPVNHNYGYNNSYPVVRGASNTNLSKVDYTPLRSECSPLDRHHHTYNNSDLVSQGHPKINLSSVNYMSQSQITSKVQPINKNINYFVENFRTPSEFRGINPKHYPNTNKLAASGNSYTPLRSKCSPLNRYHHVYNNSGPVAQGLQKINLLSVNYMSQG